MFRSNSSLPRLGKLPTGKSAVISVLDIGSSKICCTIARLTPREGSEMLPGRSHTIEVLGIGHQRSLGIKRKALPAEHPELGVSLHNLGDIARQRGLEDNAIALHLEALEVFETALGPDHRFVGHAAHGLATATRATGRLEEAEGWFRRALLIRRDLDPGSPLLRETIEPYASLLRELGREAEAREVEMLLTPVRETAPAAGVVPQ